MGNSNEIDFGGSTIVVKAIRTGAVAPGKTSGTVAATTAGGSAITVSKASHLGRTILLDTAPTTATLPAATGTGDSYSFLATLAGAHVIKVANATDTMVGVIFIGSASAQACAVDVAGGTDDTLTMNATTTGGIAGSYVTVTDIASGKWYVQGTLASSGTAASAQFSATVS